MKKIIAILLAVVMVLGLCACGATEEGGASTGGDEKQTVGILMPTKEQTIWSIQGDRLVEGFEKAGYATMIEYAEDDASKQAMQIENMITKGADALIVVAVSVALPCPHSCFPIFHFVSADHPAVCRVVVDESFGIYCVTLFLYVASNVIVARRYKGLYVHAPCGIFQ